MQIELNMADPDTAYAIATLAHLITGKPVAELLKLAAGKAGAANRAVLAKNLIDGLKAWNEEAEEIERQKREKEAQNAGKFTHKTVTL